MKATLEQGPQGFQPVTLTLVLETPEEVQALYDIANYNVAVSGSVEEREQRASGYWMRKVLVCINGALQGHFGCIGHSVDRLA